jgi:hypothetical protein
MRWRDMLLGALVTLVVTVLGSVATYYLTRDPNALQRREDLVYEWQEPTSYESDQESISIATLRATNAGDGPARSIEVVVELPKGTKLVKHKLSLSSGPLTAVSDDATNQRIFLKLSTLMPGEVATLSLMTQGILRDRPLIGLRSADSVGRQELGLLRRRSADTDELSDSLKILVPSAVGFQLIVLLLLVPGVRKKLLKLAPTRRSSNNTAFLYIHRGLTREAVDLLALSIRQHGADAVTLANYGLALGLEGHPDAARARLEAAEWWARHKHEKAVVSFNKAILCWHEGRPTDGIADLERAVRLSKREILRYSDFSVHVQLALKTYPAIAKVFTEA